MHVERITPIVKLDLKLKVKLILRSSLYDYSDTYILVSGIITVAEVAAG